MRAQTEQSYDPVLDLIPKEQCERVFNQTMVDIEPRFVGFTQIYKALSEIIPRHFTIVDLGCAYNPQCFYFQDHKKYMAVDLPAAEWRGGKIERFQSDNCEIFEMDIRDFIEKHIDEVNLKETFAICNYVPNWGQDNKQLVRESFENCYVYYPHRNESLIQSIGSEA